ncbi:MAG: acetate uptake transporter [Nitrososphaerota archaeon]|jgi:succinate-acetate transporter protein|uniref:acetate uptake transporter n=1 Tax=Candidatus Bathycorpusculum sp. TaxID=2994959 RepID=UPI0028376BF1|nr:acetate uptake transporter [Candidatus Termiticorpusculum sp.]MCL2256919.1 acetate uptake transporter [Candidatus Termiticorpusculum sp.]MCL2292957.1 acetate uptake transporter [Candidatus Termiticorpusculum sp.]MDR0461581.1 acetate uptake transporter [Nitrososphaerota archaeon]
MSDYKLANPAPLGLLAFGVSTVILNLHNEGLFALNSMVLAMGIAFGGLAQIIVGIMEYRRGNTFGTVAFASYGFFWWSLVLTLLMPGMSFFGAVAPANSIAMAAYFIMWGIFTFALFFGTLKTNRALQFVFMSLAILFFLLAAKELLGNPVWFGVITGIEGIMCGASAIYLGVAEVINEANNKDILPIGVVKNAENN